MDSQSDPRPKPAQRIVPALNYGDAPAAIEFLCRAFGFEEVYRYMDGDRVGYAELALDGHKLTLASAYPEFGFVTPGDLAGVSSQLCVFVDDLDDHYARARDAGATVLEPADNHGSRQYRAVDPEGHRWIFTQVEAVAP